MTTTMDDIFKLLDEISILNNDRAKLEEAIKALDERKEGLEEQILLQREAALAESPAISDLTVGHVYETRNGSHVLIILSGDNTMRGLVLRGGHGVEGYRGTELGATFGIGTGIAHQHERQEPTNPIEAMMLRQQGDDSDKIYGEYAGEATDIINLDGEGFAAMYQLGLVKDLGPVSYGES